MIDITAYGLLPHTSPRAKVGETFGRYTVLAIGKVQRSDGRFKAAAIVSCSCGTPPRLADIYSLTIGTQTSCGCARTDTIATHRMSSGLLYRRWHRVKARCYNPKHDSYPLYGGRGIKVCDRWLDFANFAADMSEGFQPGLEIDRKDVNGDYEPSNCRWVTHDVQMRNKRNTRNLTHLGKTQCIAQWAKELGITARMIAYRLDTVGWDTEKTLSIPPMSKAQTTKIARDIRRSKKTY